MTTSHSRSTLSLLLALQRVLTPSGFLYGSNDELFRDAHFGRDALESAEDLLPMRPDIAHAVIARLAALQGTRTDTLSEEEPGKIHHEHRALTMDGRPVSEHAREVLWSLARTWDLGGQDGATPEQITYYGTVDATPLYVRLVAEYCARHGRDILSESYSPMHASAAPSRTIRESVQAALDWIAGRVESSDLGLLEFQRLNPRGHRYQAWKDGGYSYLHTNGEPANYDGPIASIEVQGLAYDALTLGADLLDDAPQVRRHHWRRLAERVQRAVFHQFWMPDELYLAMAIDRDRSGGAPRQVKLVSSNAASLLDSKIFDTLDPETRQSMISGIVDRIYSSEFLTPAGIRCNSLRHANIPGYHAYQSSYTVWHKETYDIAKGLRRHGFERLADDLEHRLLNAINVSGGAREFLYVMADGRVDYRSTRTQIPGAEEIRGTNVPERDQTWSIAAGLAIKWCRGKPRERHAAPGWVAELEARKLAECAPVTLYRTIHEIEDALPTTYRFWVNVPGGWEREKAHPDVSAV